MSLTSSGIDIYQRFELEVLTPKKHLLVDSFLPSPESLPSTVTPLPPPPLPAVSEEESDFMARLEAREPDVAQRTDIVGDERYVQRLLRGPGVVHAAVALDVAVAIVSDGPGLHAPSIRPVRAYAVR